jgi:hypothetical protein
MYSTPRLFYGMTIRFLIFLFFFFRLEKVKVTESGRKTDQNRHDGDKQTRPVSNVLLKHSLYNFSGANLDVSNEMGNEFCVKIAVHIRLCSVFCY